MCKSVTKKDENCCFRLTGKICRVVLDRGLAKSRCWSFRTTRCNLRQGVTDQVQKHPWFRWLWRSWSFRASFDNLLRGLAHSRCRLACVWKSIPCRYFFMEIISTLWNYTFVYHAVCLFSNFDSKCVLHLLCCLHVRVEHLGFINMAVVTEGWVKRMTTTETFRDERDVNC